MGKVSGVAEISAATKKMPKQARAIARVEAIMAATERLLLTEGPDGLTTTAIARAAQIPVGSVYQYFSDRDDILQRLYIKALDGVMARVAACLESLPEGMSFSDINRTLLETFWQTARAHTTFRPLTRWANRSHSIWEVTPGINSHLDEMVEGVLLKAGIEIEPERRPAVIKTATVTISFLVDQAIEEDDDRMAEMLISELARLISSYLS